MLVILFESFVDQYLESRLWTLSLYRTIHQRHRLPEDPRSLHGQADHRVAARMLPSVHVSVILLPHFLLSVGNRLPLLSFIRPVRDCFVAPGDLHQWNLLRFLVPQCKFLKRIAQPLQSINLNFFNRFFGTFTFQRSSLFSWFPWSAKFRDSKLVTTSRLRSSYHGLLSESSRHFTGILPWEAARTRWSMWVLLLLNWYFFYLLFVLLNL